jgi:hypothetical protein
MFSRNHTKVFRNDTKTFCARIADFLRAQHPAKTAQSAAALIGVDAARVAKWLDGTSAPNGPALVALFNAYGPAFLAAVMGDCAPRWLDDAARAERLAAIEARQALLDRELQDLKEARAARRP